MFLLLALVRFSTTKSDKHLLEESTFLFAELLQFLLFGVDLAFESG